MRLATIAIFLAAVGCAETVTREDMDDLRLEMSKFEAEAANKNDLQVHLYNELVTKHSELTKKTAETEMLLKAMEAALARIEEKTNNLPAGAGSANTTPGKSVADILLDTETMLARLRSGKSSSAECADKLRDYAKTAAPYLLDEIRKSVANVDYTVRIEEVLARFPRSELEVPLRDALREPVARLSAARIISAVGDHGLSRLLEAHAAADDEDFRVIAGEAMTRCRNATGIPVLLRCLRSPHRDTRTIAVTTLRPLAGGADFGYRAQLSVEENAPALQKWEEWGEKSGKTVFDAPEKQ